MDANNPERALRKSTRVMRGKQKYNIHDEELNRPRILSTGRKKTRKASM